MSGSTARLHMNADVRLRSTICRQLSKGSSCTDCPPCHAPTRCARTSTAPSFSRTSVTQRATEASSVTSAGTTIRPAPVSPSSARRLSTASSRVHVTATRQPSSRRRRVTATPRAPVPPVTSATRPVGTTTNVPSGRRAGNPSHSRAPATCVDPLDREDPRHGAVDLSVVEPVRRGRVDEVTEDAEEIAAFDEEGALVAGEQCPQGRLRDAEALLDCDHLAEVVGHDEALVPEAGAQKIVHGARAHRCRLAGTDGDGDVG